MTLNLAKAVIGYGTDGRVSLQSIMSLRSENSHRPSSYCFPGSSPTIGDAPI
jgi:hypothetical protein